jgi:hypothetical protein
MVVKSILLIFLIIIFVGFVGYRTFLVGEDIKLPADETIIKNEITIEGGEEREISETGGVKHSVPLEEIKSGGHSKDGIPSIDNPKFISIHEASEWLEDEEPGITLFRGKTYRFYPYQILVWHEIVNDTVEGERILVTYCPLCLSGFVFDPVVGEERVEFGTSGKLWKSNLVMYDRKTESLWSQILGEAIVGEMTGTRLRLLESDLIRFGEWKKKVPQGEVLSRDTGATRFYGTNPYGGYFKALDFAVNLSGGKDERLPRDAYIYGIVINDVPKAYLIGAVKEKGEVEDEFQGIKILLRYEKDIDVVRMYKKNTDGSLERINPFTAFWFSWIAVHPKTELYK